MLDYVEEGGVGSGVSVGSRESVFFEVNIGPGCPSWWPGMDARHAYRSIELMGNQVLPYFKDKYP